MPDQLKADRRKRSGFLIDEAKFDTQKTITYASLSIFAALTFWVFAGNDQGERSMVLQTVINLVIGAFGYWLGASKGAADARQTLEKMLPNSEPPKGDNP